MEPSELLTLLSRKLDELGIGYLVTDSMATIAYGEPRFTNDIDVVISLRLEDVTRFCEAFPMPEFYVSQDAVKDAVRERRQFNIIHPASGLKVDGIIPKDDGLQSLRSAIARKRGGFDLRQDRPAAAPSCADASRRHVIAATVLDRR